MTSVADSTRARGRLATASLLLCAAGLVGAAAMSADRVGGDAWSEIVSEDGAISLPDDFRRELVHLGSWFVPEGAAAGFHHVYTQQSAIEAYRRDGSFPDGAVLVKELRDFRRGDYTTGQGVASATDPTQWFVMVKDAVGRFEGHPLWGNGWGWALFEADDPGVQVATDFRADCLGCHAPAQAHDWVYVEGYPRLAGSAR